MARLVAVDLDVLSLAVSCAGTESYACSRKMFAVTCKIGARGQRQRGPRLGLTCMLMMYAPWLASGDAHSATDTTQSVSFSIHSMKGPGGGGARPLIFDRARRPQSPHAANQIAGPPATMCGRSVRTAAAAIADNQQDQATSEAHPPRAPWAAVNTDTSPLSFCHIFILDSSLFTL